MTDVLQIKLSDFEGPLDLLLHLIRQSKINIYDIPIAQITQQYLDYLHQMQSLQLDIAGDYLIMAATLMRIKSDLLLPRPPVVSEEPAAETTLKDPRSELVAQLLTYETFKTIAQILGAQAKTRQEFIGKEPSVMPQSEVVYLKPGLKVINDVALAMVRVLQNSTKNARSIPEIPSETISLQEAEQDILDSLQKQSTTTFLQLLTDLASVPEVVTKFLALLELGKDQSLYFRQNNYQADIEVTLCL